MASIRVVVERGRHRVTAGRGWLCKSPKLKDTSVSAWRNYCHSWAGWGALRKVVSGWKYQLWLEYGDLSILAEKSQEVFTSRKQATLAAAKAEEALRIHIEGCESVGAVTTV